MITNWEYTNLKSFTNSVKETIRLNNYTSIDVGASAEPWSYPECKVFLDVVHPNKPDVIFHEIDLQNRKELDRFVEKIQLEGKFDYSICSHTIEDIFNPIDVLEFLPKISKRGYIAIPSKYDEFSKLYERKYRGNAHHKQFFDVINDELVIYPKFSFIEIDERSDEITKLYKGKELVIFWEDSINYRVFGDKTPFNGDEQLISEFYRELTN